MDLAGYLDQQLRAAGVPIVGVSLKSATDRTQWTIQFEPSATQPQKDAGAALLQSVAIDALTLADSEAQGRFDDKLLKAIVIWVAAKLSISPAVARNQIITIYKGL